MIIALLVFDCFLLGACMILQIEITKIFGIIDDHEKKNAPIRIAMESATSEAYDVLNNEE